jgi:hypothetical protein
MTSHVIPMSGHRMDRLPRYGTGEMSESLRNYPVTP